MKRIALSGDLGRGKFALVDDDDYERINKHRWCLSDGYAMRKITVNGKSVSERMHRVINNTPEGFSTDHVNTNRLDNRKENLRTCTKAQNGMNRVAQKNNKLGIKGVCQLGNKFIAQISINKKRTYLGIFNNADDAQSAYKNASIKFFGEYRRNNI